MHPRVHPRERIASGTAATLVVTSKNIKNGTIQTVDLSAKAKRGIRLELQESAVA